MQICYIDEAGCTGALPSANSQIQPLLALSGVIVDFAKLHRLTSGLIALKERFYVASRPTAPDYLSGILYEVKGGDLRKHAVTGGRNIRRHAFGYLEGTLDLAEGCDIKLVSRIWVKGVGAAFNGVSVYTSSIQSIFGYFQHYLTTKDDIGVVIVDSRLKHLNTQVSHSIFTQKYKSSGDVYDRIIELPAFAHSDNHAGLQISDTFASGLLFPMAIHSYCSGHITGVHVRSGYSAFGPKFAARLSNLQYRYQEANGRWRGGIVVADDISQKSAAVMLR